MSTLCPLEKLSLTDFPDNPQAEETSLLGKGLMIRRWTKAGIPCCLQGCPNPFLRRTQHRAHSLNTREALLDMGLWQIYGRGTGCSVQRGRKAEREEFNLRPLEQLLAKTLLCSLKLLICLVPGKTDHL